MWADRTRAVRVPATKHHLKEYGTMPLYKDIFCMTMEEAAFVGAMARLGMLE
jgi:hypothetical protein